MNTAASYTFTYDSTTNLIQKITDQFNREFTFTFTNGKLTTCGSFSERESNFTHNGTTGALETFEQNVFTGTSIADPNAPVYVAPTWGFGYTTVNGASKCTFREDTAVSQTPIRTTYSFDSFGLLQEIQHPDLTTWTLIPTLTLGLQETNTTGNTIFSVSSASAKYTDEVDAEFFFKTDRYGNVIEFTAPDSGTVTTEFSNYGMMYRHTAADPDGAGSDVSPVTKVGYNFLGDRLTVAYPDSTTTTMTFDSAFHVPLTITNGLGKTTTNTIDAVGNILTTTDPDSNTWTYTWDTNGNLLTQTSPDPDGAGPESSSVTTYDYETTIYNRIQKITNPDSTSRTFTYTSADLVETVVDELGRTTKFEWDAMDRLIILTTPPASTGLTKPKWTYVYNDLTRMLESQTDPLGNKTETNTTTENGFQK